MPFVSEAQRRLLRAKYPEIAKRWEEHTPKDAKLPERVDRKRKKSERKSRSIYSSY